MREHVLSGHVAQLRISKQEISSQPRLVLVQPSLGQSVVWTDRSKVTPEVRPVVSHLQVGEFMRHDVFQHLQGREDEVPVDKDMALGAA